MGAHPSRPFFFATIASELSSGRRAARRAAGGFFPAAATTGPTEGAAARPGLPPFAGAAPPSGFPPPFFYHAHLVMNAHRYGPGPRLGRHGAELPPAGPVRGAHGLEMGQPAPRRFNSHRILGGGFRVFSREGVQAGVVETCDDWLRCLFPESWGYLSAIHRWIRMGKCPSAYNLARGRKGDA